ncbi:phosphopantothenoylcysteine decarboxylase isoform X2 [Rhodnius prolixus]|uniref:phosphopantothenoylcysteine decarboxylase isoform X2 n=1 Tax=Rhodnius prolixus TaxID=13249 RepID=UPI003D1899AA
MSLDLPELSDHLNSFTVIVSCTDKAKHFCPKTDLKNLPVDVYTDYEWDSWTTPDGNASLHDELAKKANMLLIAPLDANTLAKIANGLCDNLLTSIVRVWNFKNKIAICCPAMNTQMWVHPITDLHIKQVQSLGFVVIPPIAKKLMCGDVGVGAMAEPKDIVSVVKEYSQIERK